MEGYTTSYGSKTTCILYTVDRSDYLASYWIKMKPPIFGTHIRDLTPEIIRVNYVVEGHLWKLLRMARKYGKMIV